MRTFKGFASKRQVLLIRLAAIILPTVLGVLFFSQKAFATNTYVITDGARVITYTTTATDPRKILGEAGLTLDANDTYTTQSGLGTSEITVRRSQTISIDYCGEEITATSYGETVEQLLHRLNLSLGENDRLSRPLSDETFDGMSLSIERVLCQNQTYTTSLPHGIIYCEDPNLPQGMEEILVEGVDGEMLCTVSVTYVNGREVHRDLLEQIVSVRPVDQVIALGTGLAAVPTSDANLPIITEDKIILPTGEVLSYVGSTTARATAYYNQGTTATGTTAQEGVVAVDPSFIPHGTRMFIITNDGEYVYGISAAEDAGDSNIVGNRIDLWFSTRAECIQFGFRECTVYFLGSN